MLIEIDAVTPDDWVKCGEHCVKIKEEFVKAGLRNEILEPIILNINLTKAVPAKMKMTNMRIKLFQLRKIIFFVNIIIIVSSFISYLVHKCTYIYNCVKMMHALVIINK